MSHTLSIHAEARCQKWGVSYDDIGFILKHAHREYRTGVIFYQMRDKKMPASAEKTSYYRLRGVTVIACTCKMFIVTLYKNPDAYKEDRCKPKYDNRDGDESCPLCSGQAVAA